MFLFWTKVSKDKNTTFTWLNTMHVHLSVLLFPMQSFFIEVGAL